MELWSQGVSQSHTTQRGSHERFIGEEGVGRGGAGVAFKWERMKTGLGEKMVALHKGTKDIHKGRVHNSCWH